MRTPWRLVASGFYDGGGALAVYLKVAALARRAELCTARVETLASYLGMSRRAVERALTLLCNPQDGVVEIVTRRRTAPGGTGESAERRPRPLGGRELFVWLPVAAAGSMSPRELVLYAALAYATDRGMPVTDAELAALCEVTPRRVSSLRRALADRGWITVHERAGRQGRHAYTVHQHPIQPVLGEDQEPEPEPGTPELNGGSGHDLHGGSLANTEDLSTGRRAPQGTGTDAVSPPRRRREPVVARGHVETVDNPAPPTSPAGTCGAGRVSGTGYAGPGLQLSPRIWAVLEPVRDLVADMDTWPLRRAAQIIGQQLDEFGGHMDPAAAVERMRARIERRRAMTAGAIRDPGRWLLGVGIADRGCGLLACEDGWLVHSGARCEVCADLRAAELAAQAAPPPAPRPRPAPSPPAAAEPPPAPPPRPPGDIEVRHCACGQRIAAVPGRTQCARCRPPTTPRGRRRRPLTTT